AISEQVGGGPVDELEAPIGDPLPVVGGHPLAHDAASDRHELVVDIRNALGVDLRPNALDRLCAAVGAGESFEVCAHGTSWREPSSGPRLRRSAKGGALGRGVPSGAGARRNYLRTVNPVS